MSSSDNQVTFIHYSLLHRANPAQTLAWPQADCVVERKIPTLLHLS